MDAIGYVLIAVSIVISAAALAVVMMLYKRKNTGAGADIDMGAFAEAIERDMQAFVRGENGMVIGTVKAYSERLAELDRRIAALTQALGESMDKLRESMRGYLVEVKNDNAAQLERVRRDNAEQLEKMRETVDEKLNSTLQNRFDSSFKLVSDRLEAITKNFQELQSLQNGVNDLNRIFKNVKTRGTWGEVALESLLSQVLNEEQYEKQYNISGKGSELVDFAIKLPGKGDGTVMLPVDAKFPIEDYQRLIEASDNADADGVERAGKMLEQSVKKFAQSIREKYVMPPKTTDFAIMYLPVEGLYAEVVKRHGLMEYLQNQYRVVICGPTTLAALLNSLQVGFMSVAIEKRSTEISKLLTAFSTDFDKFCVLLQRTGKQLEGVQSNIAKADKRTELIRKKLSKVQKYAGEIGEDEKRALLASDDDEDYPNDLVAEEE